MFPLCSIYGTGTEKAQAGARWGACGPFKIVAENRGHAEAAVTR
ncbi:hypothetical protein [Mesorhizobium sp. M5C.F.Cr.IN.023.01.1.1]|nr:hypothetical protein [Mesorhizobium sp. M5C.F.Cr.IN.023.01.1.1]